MTGVQTCALPIWLIDHLLAVHDRHLLHGACLIAPAADGALALFAPSGTGKTTTALALARAGFALAGDDALVLRNTDQGALMWAVPRRLRVHRKTAAMMPWLEPSLGEWSGDEQAVSRESLSGVVGVVGPTLSRAVGIVVLRPPNANGHHIERIGKAEAVSHIVADNVRRAPMGVEPHAQAAFAAIARFAAPSRTRYRDSINGLITSRKSVANSAICFSKFPPGPNARGPV